MLTRSETDEVRRALTEQVKLLAKKREACAELSLATIAVALGLIADKLCDAIPEGELNVNAWDMGKP